MPMTLIEMLTFTENKNSGECNLKIYFCSFSLLAATIHRCASTIYSQKSDWLSGKWLEKHFQYNQVKRMRSNEKQKTENRLNY